MITKIALIVVLIFCNGAFAVPSAHTVQSANQRAQSNAQSCVLLAVTDGDSILARCQQTSERIRLIGIDAPELHHGEHSERQSNQYGQSDEQVRQLGKQARSHLSSILKIGETLELRQDREMRDRYGRLLAYVYTSDGTMINSRMIADGFATPMTIKPNTAHKLEFEQLYASARRERRGIWSQIQ